MTKLGVVPGVHGGQGEEKPEDDVSTIKVDPKVFTVLQPPVQVPPIVVQKKGSNWCKWTFFIVLLICSFLLALTALDLYFATNDMVTDSVTQKPTSDALKKDEKESLIMPFRVMVIDGGSNDENKEEKEPADRKVVEGSVEKPEEQRPEIQTNIEMMQPPMNPWADMEARYLQHMQEARMWRIRRLQQAMYHQQMMREMAARQYWAQMQQQMRWAEAQQQRAQQMQQQMRWAEVQEMRAQQEQAMRAEQERRARWEAGRMEQLRMEQARTEEARRQEWQEWAQRHAAWAQQQAAWAAQQQQAQIAQQQPQQLMWQQQQQQEQPQPQQQQPQQQWTQFQMWQQPQPQVQPVQPVQPAIHDRIYEQLQKKSQEMQFNAPSKPIWTAITPTPEPAVTVDQDAIFQENLKKALEQEAQQTTPVVETTTAAAVDATTENVFKVFEEKPQIPVEDVFKAFEEKTEEPKEVSKEEEKEEPKEENVFKTVENVDIPVEQPKSEDEQPKSEENVFAPFAANEDQTVAEQSGFTAFNKDGTVGASEEVRADDSSIPVPVIFEDRFPIIEERTTTAEPVESPAEGLAETDDDEHDPLAAFLKYFEQEARKLAEMRMAAVPTEQSTEVVEGEAADPTASSAESAESTVAVDVPEPNFAFARTA